MANELRVAVDVGSRTEQRGNNGGNNGEQRGTTGNNGEQRGTTGTPTILISQPTTGECGPWRFPKGGLDSNGSKSGVYGLADCADQ